jgi:site-specific DNA-methyltransferase (adenine-specific)/adenine-specific DNA-methyltransferase
MNFAHGQIVTGDCIEGMRQLPAGAFNLIVADPPYNLNKDFGAWKETERKAEWRGWMRIWLSEAFRVLSDSGNIFVYGIHHHNCWTQCIMYELGYSYRRQIIWNYENGFAGYGKRTLSAYYEPVLWFSKTEKYIYHPIREPYKSLERLKHKIIKNGKVWEPNPDGRMAGDVWSFPTLAGRRFRDEKVNHPTQKPLALSRRIVRHFSDRRDVILVPFAGSGSECVAAVMEERRYLGFELNPQYVAIAEQRIGEADQQARLFAT